MDITVFIGDKRYPGHYNKPHWAGFTGSQQFDDLV